MTPMSRGIQLVGCFFFICLTCNMFVSLSQSPLFLSEHSCYWILFTKMASSCQNVFFILSKLFQAINKQLDAKKIKRDVDVTELYLSQK